MSTLEQKMLRELKWSTDVAASAGLRGVADERAIIERLNREMPVARKRIERDVRALMEKLNEQGVLIRFSAARPYLYHVDGNALMERMNQ